MHNNASSFRYSDALIQQATSQIQSGNILAGLRNFEMASEQDPDNVQALIGHGVAHSLSGNHIAAIKSFNKAHRLDPHEPQITANLGHAYMAVNDTQKALNAFKLTCKLNQKDPDSAYWAGKLAADLGETDQAELYFRHVLKLTPDHRESALQLSNILFHNDDKLGAFKIITALEKRYPGDNDLVFLRGQLLKKSVPGWHLSMLDDHARNEAYDAAICASVNPGDIVLDIGTGSGLLAMMAARAGAGHVYACEQDPILAHLAQDIIAKNGYSDKITIIAKNSQDLIIGKDMPQKADMLVSEIFDSAIVGEGVLPSINHAQQHLLKGGAKIIPQKATLKAVLTQCPHLHRHDNVGNVSGFDLEAMRALALPYSHRDAQIYFDTSDEAKTISETFDMHVFDFEKPLPLGFNSSCDITVNADSDADSVLMWFDLELVEGVYFTTRHSKTQHHWRPATQIIASPIPCKAGETLRLKTHYEGYFDFMIEKP